MIGDCQAPQRGEIGRCCHDGSSGRLRAQSCRCQSHDLLGLPVFPDYGGCRCVPASEARVEAFQQKKRIGMRDMQIDRRIIRTIGYPMA